MILKFVGIFSFVPLIAIVVFFLKLFTSLYNHGPKALNATDVIGLGASFLTWGVWFIIFFCLMKMFGVTTTGKVIGFKSISESKAFNSIGRNLTDQNAVIEFQTSNGEVHRFTSPYTVSTITLIGSSLKKTQNLAMGDPMEVVYDPNNPDRAIENRLAMQLFSVLFFVVGFVLLWVGLRLRS